MVAFRPRGITPAVEEEAFHRLRRVVIAQGRVGLRIVIAPLTRQAHPVVRLRRLLRVQGHLEWLGPWFGGGQGSNYLPELRRSNR